MSTTPDLVLSDGGPELLVALYAFMKGDPGDGEGGGGGALVNSLTSTDSTKALAASQGPAITALVTTEATTRATAITNEVTARNAAISTAIAALLNGAPGALDTLKELADAMGDDPNFAATVTNALAGKATLAQALTIANLVALMSGAGNVVATQTSGLLRFDLNFNFVVSNPSAIPNVDGALLTRVSAPFTALLNRMSSAEGRLTALEAGGGGGSPAPVATKFYAVSTTTNGGSTYLAVQQVDFFLNESDTVPYSTTSNCTASATDTPANSSGTALTAYFTLDGNLVDESHSWVSGQNTTRPTFLNFEFATAVLIKKIVIYRERVSPDIGYGDGISRAPVNFKLLKKVLIDDDWTTLLTVTSATWGSDPGSATGQSNTYYVNGGVAP